MSVRLGARRSPAAPLYEEVCGLVSRLELGDRMALADALNDGHPWEALPERLKDLFGELLAWTRRRRP